MRYFLEFTCPKCHKKNKSEEVFFEETSEKNSEKNVPYPTLDDKFDFFKQKYNFIKCDFCEEEFDLTEKKNLENIRVVLNKKDENIHMRKMRLKKEEEEKQLLLRKFDDCPLRKKEYCLNLSPSNCKNCSSQEEEAYLLPKEWEEQKNAPSIFHDSSKLKKDFMDGFSSMEKFSSFFDKVLNFFTILNFIQITLVLFGGCSLSQPYYGRANGIIFIGSVILIFGILIVWALEYFLVKFLQSFFKFGRAVLSGFSLNLLKQQDKDTKHNEPPSSKA